MPVATSHAPLLDLIAKYEGRAPRYTSYPTAVQFTPEVDAELYRTWLAILDPADPVSLYIHIPFCGRLCWYCGCNTRAVTRPEPIADYMDLLGREIGLLADALPARLSARALHLGGGTPNILAPDQVHALFDRLEGAFDFYPDLDVAMELDPAVLTRDWVRAAAARGLTRASLGVQSLAPSVQRAVNRHDTYDQIANSVAWLREAGVASINLDLIYGLPHQTTADTLDTLDQVLALRPDRLALFGYAHVPWMKTHQKLIPEAALPDGAARLEQSESAAERLEAEGYVRIGLDHFALPGDSLALAQLCGALRRNFQGYTDDPATTLLGLGASAIGQTPSGFAQNASRELDWRAQVAAGALPIARGVAVTAEDRLRGEIIERLMCDLSVDLAAVARAHGVRDRDFSPELARLRGFAEDGLVEISGLTVTATGRGRLLIRSLAAVFDAYFTPEATRHSRAI
jgi:oxygen-independent coproporphyrinogen-3 oxidase